jgi:hypothetical protein
MQRKGGLRKMGKERDEKKMPEIVYLKDLTWDEAQKEADKLSGRIPTNKELDSMIQQGILNLDLFPVWVGTHLEYVGTYCKITEIRRK